MRLCRENSSGAFIHQRLKSVVITRKQMSVELSPKTNMSMIKRFFSAILVALVPLFVASCGDDEPYSLQNTPQGGDDEEQTDDLTDTEKGLVGSYVSDDYPTSVFYLVLNSDRTGFHRTQNMGQAVSGESFTWAATSSLLQITYDSDGYEVYVDYEYSDDHLIVDGISLVENDGDVPELYDIDSPVVGLWRGNIAGYYDDVFELDEDEYSLLTIFQFYTDGTGLHVDYNVQAPTQDYAYSPFYWCVTSDSVKIEYASDNEVLYTAAISPYAATSTSLTGHAVFEPYGLAGYDIDMQAITDADLTAQSAEVRSAEAKPRFGRQKTAAMTRLGNFAAAY